MKENYHILEVFFFSINFLFIFLHAKFYSSSINSEIREERSDDVLPTHHRMSHKRENIYVENFEMISLFQNILLLLPRSIFIKE